MFYFPKINNPFNFKDNVNQVKPFTTIVIVSLASWRIITGFISELCWQQRFSETSWISPGSLDCREEYCRAIVHSVTLGQVALLSEGMVSMTLMKTGCSAPAGSVGPWLHCCAPQTLSWKLWVKVHIPRENVDLSRAHTLAAKQRNPHLSSKVIPLGITKIFT